VAGAGLSTQGPRLRAERGPAAPETARTAPVATGRGRPGRVEAGPERGLPPARCAGRPLPVVRLATARGGAL